MNPVTAADPSNTAAPSAPAPDELAALKALVQTAEHTLLRVFHQNLAALANIDDLTKITDNIARLAAIRKTIAQLSAPPSTQSPGINPTPDRSDPSNTSDPSNPSGDRASSFIPRSLEQAHADLHQVATATAQLAQSSDSPHLGTTSTPSSPSTPSIPAHSSPSSPNSHDSHSSHKSLSPTIPHSTFRIPTGLPVTGRSSSHSSSPVPPLKPRTSKRNFLLFEKLKHSAIRACFEFRASDFEFDSARSSNALAISIRPCPSLSLRAIPRAKLAATLHHVNAYITTTLTPIVLETFRRTRDKRLLPQLFHLLFHAPLPKSAPIGPLPPLIPDG